jgi:CRP-like cAMP-binding protein
MKYKNNNIIYDFLNKNNLSHLFSKDDINYFEIKTFFKGSNIISSQEDLDGIYFIISGGVDIHSYLLNGRSIFINKLSPPDTFGDVEYFGNIKTLFDVSSNADKTVVMKIPFNILNNQLKENHYLWKFLGETSTRKLLKTNSAILLKESFDLKTLLAIYLVKNNFTITFNSLNELSLNLNVSYRNLTRVIKYFSDKKIIKKERKSIITLDKDAINKYTNEI